jgi:hypothetical protein
LFANQTSGNISTEYTSSTKLQYTPSSGLLAATTFSGSGASLTNIPNAALTNSSITIGSTAVSLGGTATTIAGLTSVTSTTFVGALTGNASTATSATTATNATNTAITDDVVTSSSVYPTWVTTTTGNLPQKTSSTKLSFVPSTGVLSATTFSGVWNGTAVGIGYGGTGQTTAAAGFNALSPITTTGDLIIGNGSNSATRLGIGTNGYVLTSNGTTASWAAATGGVTQIIAGTNVTISPAGGTGAVTINASGGGGGSLTISNDTSTASNLYPTFLSATSGTASTIYTSNANLLYKPSTGELQANEVTATNGIFLNATTISSNYTIAASYNAGSFGPVSVASGVTVTVSSGSVWSIV